MSKTPKVRMDKSNPHSTVHGERPPGDPHAGVAFYQNGLPFDAEGFLMRDKVPESDTKLSAMADRLIKKAAGQKSAPAPDIEDEAPVVEDNGDDEDDDTNAPNEVNLEGWLRGDKFEWFSVQKAIRERFNKQVSNKTDAVTFLVETEKVVQPDQLAEPMKQFYVPEKV